MRCDCTHYCLDSAVSAAGVSLALNLLADIFRAHAPVPPPPDSADADCAAGHGVTFACRRGYKNAVDIKENLDSRINGRVVSVCEECLILRLLFRRHHTRRRRALGGRLLPIF